MDQHELRTHILKFAKRRGRFLLEVECPDTYAGISLSDRKIALMLCATAKRSGVTKYIRLYEYPDADTETVVFDSLAWEANSWALEA
jgi:hypothetical protein